MIIPLLLARVKQWGDFAGLRINAREIGAFAQVAVNAREAEVRLVVGAAVLARADVLDVQGGEGRVVLMKLAILAAIRSAPTHQGARRGIHSELVFIARASRRRVATNLLART